MLRVKGKSMIEAGIYDRDLILVRQQNDAINGDDGINVHAQWKWISARPRHRFRVQRVDSPFPALRPSYIPIFVFALRINRSYIEDTFPIPIEYIHNDTVFMLRVKGKIRRTGLILLSFLLYHKKMRNSNLCSQFQKEKSYRKYVCLSVRGKIRNHDKEKRNHQRKHCQKRQQTINPISQHQCGQKGNPTQYAEKLRERP